MQFLVCFAFALMCSELGQCNAADQGRQKRFVKKVPRFDESCFMMFYMCPSSQEVPCPEGQVLDTRDYVVLGDITCGCSPYDICVDSPILKGRKKRESLVFALPVNMCPMPMCAYREVTCPIDCKGCEVVTQMSYFEWEGQKCQGCSYSECIDANGQIVPSPESLNMRNKRSTNSFSILEQPCPVVCCMEPDSEASCDAGFSLKTYSGYDVYNNVKCPSCPYCVCVSDKDDSVTRSPNYSSQYLAEPVKARKKRSLEAAGPVIIADEAYPEPYPEEQCYYMCCMMPYMECPKDTKREDKMSYYTVGKLECPGCPYLVCYDAKGNTVEPIEPVYTTDPVYVDEPVKGEPVVAATMDAKKKRSTDCPELTGCETEMIACSWDSTETSVEQKREVDGRLCPACPRQCCLRDDGTEVAPLFRSRMVDTNAAPDDSRVKRSTDDKMPCPVLDCPASDVVCPRGSQEVCVQQYADVDGYVCPTCPEQCCITREVEEVEPLYKMERSRRMAPYRHRRMVEPSPDVIAAPWVCPMLMCAAPTEPLDCGDGCSVMSAPGPYYYMGNTQCPGCGTLECVCP